MEAGGYKGTAPSIGLPGSQIARSAEVQQLPPADGGEPDQGVVAAGTANDHAQIPHLVDHRLPEPADPAAPPAGVLRGRHLEGEDLPEGTGRGVAVKPHLVHVSNLPSLRSVRF